MNLSRNRFLTLLIIFSLIISILPVSSSAQNYKSSSELESNQDAAIAEATPVDGIIEIESMRTENSKTFSLPDGRYSSVYYGTPIHKKDSSGIWKDINYSLSLTTRDNSQQYTTSDQRVSFSPQLSPNAPIFSLQESGYSISLSLVSNSFANESTKQSSSTAIIKNPIQRRSSQVFSSIDEAKTITNTSSVVYQNILPNTDLEYVIGASIKENIIVKQKKHQL